MKDKKRRTKIYQVLTKNLAYLGNRVVFLALEGREYNNLTEEEHIELVLLARRIKAIEEKLYSL